MLIPSLVGPTTRPIIRRQDGGGQVTETKTTTGTRTSTTGTPSQSTIPLSSSPSLSSLSSSSPSSPSSSSSSSTSSFTSSSSSPSATLSSETQGSSGISTSALIGAIVGGTIGLLLLLIILSVLFTAYRRRRNDVRKRPRMSVVVDGTKRPKSKRPETVYDIDSFLGSTKPSLQYSGEASNVPLLPPGNRPGSAYEPPDGVNEHGVVDRYTDRPSSPAPSSPVSTASHSEFSHLVSPYSTDGHGEDKVCRSPPSLPMSSYSTGATSTSLTAPLAGFALVLNESNNGSGLQATGRTSTTNVLTIPPPPSSPSNISS